jgi:glycosyltransferase involved in cell wall biosynthesis
MRKIGLDLRVWSHPGIGRYLRELVKALSETGTPQKFSFLVYPGDRAAVRNFFPNADFVEASSRIYSLREQAELWGFSRQVDLLHVPHFNAPLVCSSKLVVTVHDLIYLKDARFSGSFLGKLYARSLFQGIVRNAKAVIAVSQFTKKDLVETFPKLDGRVEVIYEAASARFRQSPDPKALRAVKERLGLMSPFILFVGSFKAHKNLPVLLDAFQNLKKNNSLTHELVLVGKKDPKESQLFRRIEGMPHARCLESVGDDDLFALYHLAKVLVVPSLWEGFGLPMLEAMACGTPVLCSDRSSLPEIAGDAALTFDPERADRLEELLIRVLQDDSLRQTLSAKGFVRANRFSWEKAARETLKLYEKVVG